jgi:excisionase family DNA binding protein
MTKLKKREFNTPFMTRDELADYFRISKHTLNHWASCGMKGNLPYYKIGGTILYKKEDIDKFIEESKVEFITEE